MPPQFKDLTWLFVSIFLFQYQYLCQIKLNMFYILEWQMFNSYWLHILSGSIKRVHCYVFSNIVPKFSMLQVFRLHMNVSRLKSKCNAISYITSISKGPNASVFFCILNGHDFRLFDNKHTFSQSRKVTRLIDD